jgi:hypothetical protein
MRACVSTSGSIDECVDFLRIVLRRVGAGAVPVRP